MNQYIQIIFPDLQAEIKDILIAQLADAGFEGFEETENGLNAFIKKDEYDKFLLEKISDACQTKFSETIIDDTNWNQLWESNFQPVVVNKFVGIRADFHEPIKNVQYEIIITP